MSLWVQKSEKILVWKYLRSIIDDSVNMFDEIINDENSSDQK